MPYRQSTTANCSRVGSGAENRERERRWRFSLCALNRRREERGSGEISSSCILLLPGRGRGGGWRNRKKGFAKKKGGEAKSDFFPGPVSAFRETLSTFGIFANANLFLLFPYSYSNVARPMINARIAEGFTRKNKLNRLYQGVSFLRPFVFPRQKNRSRASVSNRPSP